MPASLHKRKRFQRAWPRRAARAGVFRRPLLEWLEDRTVFSGATMPSAMPLSFTAFQTAHAADFLANPNQVDLYSVALNPGDEVNAAVSAQTSGSGLQSILRVFNASGTAIALDDQEGGDPRLTFQAPSAGTYFIGVSAAGNDTYDPTRSSSSQGGTSTGLYTLDLRLTPSVPLEADLTGASFRLATATAAYGDTISGSFTIQNRGGANAGAFNVQVALSSSNLFKPAPLVLTTFSVPALASGQPFTVGNFTVSLPSLASATAAGLPSTGPVYLGLRIDPAAHIRELNAFDQSGVHRGEDWESVSILMPVAASGSNRVPAAAVILPGLNNQISGTLAAGQTDWYQFSVSFSGRFTASVIAEPGSAASVQLALTGSDGQTLIQSGGTSIVQDLVPDTNGKQLEPQTYLLAVSSASGAGAYVVSTGFTLSNLPFRAEPGFQPGAAAVGDFSGSGNLDMVVVGLPGSFSRAALLSGNGDGTFQPPQMLDAGVDPFIVAVADINGDGHPDLVFVNEGAYGARLLTVMLGSGDGTFQKAQTFSVGQPSALAVADVNGDGRPDLILDNGALEVLINTTKIGSNTVSFRSLAPILTTVPSVALLAADFTGDGRPDLIDVGASGQVLLLAGNGDGSFGAPEQIATVAAPFTAAAADLNDDGLPDLVTLGSSTLSVILNQGSGSFDAPTNYTVGSRLGPFDGFTVADLNGDGRLDLAVTNDEYSQITVLLGDGNGSFRQLSPFLTNDPPSGVGAADVNNDGQTDLLALSTGGLSVTTYPGRGDGTFQGRQVFGVGSAPRAIALADLNGDGQTDVVVANYKDNTVSVLLGNGDGTFQPQRVFAVGSEPDAVAIADINGDGKPDIVTANYGDDTLSVLLGNGDGTFSPQQIIKVEGAPRALAIADINGDGKPDLIVGAADGTIGVLLGNGGGTFGPETFYKVGATVSSLTVADINGDGRPDIIWTDYDRRAVGVLFGTPGGTFTAQQVQRLPFHPASAVVADVNGDGLPDLLVAGGNNLNNPYLYSYSVAVLIGNGRGSFKDQQNISVYGDVIAAADVNGDGAPDLIVASGTEVRVFLNDGHGNFAGGNTFPVDSVAAAVAVADVNRDGRPDIITANSQANDISVLLGKGNGAFASITPADELGDRNTPYVADLNGDGIPDSVVLDRFGNILFRAGLPGTPGEFAAPEIINGTILNGQSANPEELAARDVTVLRTATGWAVASADAVPDPNVLATEGRFLYSVSVYTYSSDGKFQRATAFTTTLSPTRIAAADLTGDGLDDIVVVDSLDDTVQVAFQQRDGTFTAPITRSVGMAPSDIAFADLNRDGLPDIILTDEASGDLTVLVNDANHTFTTTERLPAGTGLYGLDTTASTPTVSSTGEPISLAVGDFTGDGRNDVVVVNRGAHSFSVLAGDGKGGLASPQVNLTTSTSDGLQINEQPGPIVAGDFNRDGKLDLAILMDDTGEVWIYTGHGDGTFTHTASYAVGNLATGLSMAPGSAPGLIDLLVGNQYGDVLRLKGNGNGTFQNYEPIDPVKAIAMIGTNHFIVSEQANDQLVVQQGTNGAVQVVQNRTNGILMPGKVQVVTTAGSQYLVMADSGANDLLVYPIVNGQVDAAGVQKFGTGTDPQGITVADLNGDGSPDLVVANEGSNDVSVFFGQGQGASWTLTPGPRLASDGIGPTDTLTEDVTGPNGKPDGIPDLLISNSVSNNVTVLPGVGGGFFNDVNPLTIPVGSQPVQILSVGSGIATVNFGSNDVTFIPNLADPTAEQTISSGGAGPVDAVVADVDNHSSLVVANEEDGSIALLLGEADGLAGPQLLAGADVLSHPTALVLSPLGNAVFVADSASDAIARFDLQTSSPILPGPGGVSSPGLGGTSDDTTPASLTAFPVPLSQGTVAFVATLLTSTGQASPTSTGSVHEQTLTSQATAFAAQNMEQAEGAQAAPGTSADVNLRWFNFLSGIDDALRDGWLEEAAPGQAPAANPGPQEDGLDAGPADQTGTGHAGDTALRDTVFSTTGPALDFGGLAHVGAEQACLDWQGVALHGIALCLSIVGMPQLFLVHGRAVSPNDHFPSLSRQFPDRLKIGRLFT